jgi:hypothetical protein
VGPEGFLALAGAVDARFGEVLALLKSHGSRLQNLEYYKYYRELLGHPGMGSSGAVEFLEAVDALTTSRVAQLSAVAQALSDLDSVRRSFDDVALRLDCFMALKVACKTLSDVFDPVTDKYALQMADLIYDAVRFAYAEDLTPHQVHTLQGALKELEREDLTQPDAAAVDKALWSAGLYTIPSGEEG